MTVLQVIKKYKLESFDKKYTDLNGKSHDLDNLDELMKRRVRDVYIDVRFEFAIICIITD